MADSTAWPHDAALRAWWVEPARLLAGEYPGSSSYQKTVAKVQLLVEAGVDSIVDLTSPRDGLDSYLDVLNIEADKAGRSIARFAHPIPDWGVVDHDGYDRIVARIRGEIDSGRTVYVHCWAGKGRTSTVIGCLLIDGGLDYDDAIDRIAQLRAKTRAGSDRLPETPSQHRVLRERAARPR